MVISTVYELESFFSSILIGVIFGVIYDFAKSIRAVFKKNTLPDIFMWSLIITISGIIWYNFQNGEVRWYMVLGTLTSGILYFLLISRIVFCTFLFLVRKIYCFFNIILKLLLTPLRFLCKILSVYIKKAKTKFFKKVEDKNYEKKACI